VKWKDLTSRHNSWVSQVKNSSEWKKAVDNYEAKLVRETVLKMRQKSKKEAQTIKKKPVQIEKKTSPRKRSPNPKQIKEEIEEELAQIMKSKPKKRKAPAPKKSETTKKQKAKSAEEEEYTVEAILDHQITSSSVIKYLIKWEGYESEMNTWEPEENLSNCPELLKRYKEKCDITM
jgi:hypothetical protein